VADTEFGSLRGRLAAGVTYVGRSLNADGGVPAIAGGDVSGIWTTSAALEMLCTTPYLPHERLSLALRMWEFLEQAQLDGIAGHEGAWPLVKAGTRGSSIATGHAVAAIKSAEAYFRHHLPAELLAAAEGGVSWLQNNQSDDGGWAIEPANRPHASDSFMISTVYAVLGLVAAGYSVETSEALRAAQKWILRTKSAEGAFATGIGFEPDPCNTARAVRALIEMDAYLSTDRVIRDALEFLRRSRTSSGWWSITSESFVVEGASGELVFTRNAPSDILYALALTDPAGKLAYELVFHFIANQQADGSWLLTRADRPRGDVSTWSTCEAVRALTTFEHWLSGGQIQNTPSRWRNSLVLALVAALFVETLLLMGASTALVRAWHAVPTWAQSLILGTVLVGAIINVTSNFIYDLIKRTRSRRH
jgi:prenyltransferase beta subunit